MNRFQNWPDLEAAWGTPCMVGTAYGWALLPMHGGSTHGGVLSPMHVYTPYMAVK